MLERLVCSSDEGVESQAGDGEQKRRRRALGHRAMEIIGAAVSSRAHHGAKGGQAPRFPNDSNGNRRGKILEEGRGPISICFHYGRALFAEALNTACTSMLFAVEQELLQVAEREAARRGI